VCSSDLIKKDGGQIKSRSLAEAVRNNDKVVLSAIRKAIFYLGIAVGGVINFLNPEMIILGGGVVQAMEDFYLAEVHKTAIDYSFPYASQGVRIVSARLGDDAGVLGAAVVAHTKLESARNPRVLTVAGGQQ